MTMNDERHAQDQIEKLTDRVAVLEQTLAKALHLMRDLSTQCSELALVLMSVVDPGQFTTPAAEHPEDRQPGT